MIRLVRVELRRLRYRKVGVLALLAAIFISLFALFVVHQQAAQLERAMSGADQMFEEQLQYWEENGEQDRIRCEEEQAAERRRSGDASIDFGCDQMRAPTPEDFYGQMPSLQESYEQLLRILTFPFLLLGIMLGSTHVAAEFSHRTMGSWLTFVPRRIPVYASKVTSAAIAALPVVAVGLVIVLIGVPAVYRLHGIDDNVSAAGWTDIAWTSVRILLLAGVAGAFGAALGFLLRHTAAVIGILLGYAVVVEGMIASTVPQLSRYTLMRNISAVVEDGTRWITYACDNTGNCREVAHTLSFANGAVALSVVLVVAVGLSLWRFLRSDVD